MGESVGISHSRRFPVRAFFASRSLALVSAAVVLTFVLSVGSSFIGP